MCQAAKPTTSAFLPQANPQGFNFQKKPEQVSAQQIALESAQVSHQLPHSGFCMPVVPAPAWLTCVVPLALCYLAVHIHHARKI